jgi:hypothetical protein
LVEVRCVVAAEAVLGSKHPMPLRFRRDLAALLKHRLGKLEEAQGIQAGLAVVVGTAVDAAAPLVGTVASDEVAALACGAAAAADGAAGAVAAVGDVGANGAIR